VKKTRHRLITALVLLAAPLCTTHAAENRTPVETEWNPRGRCVKQLVAAVPSILKSQNPTTGRFGTEPWVTEDQNVLLPLAAAWSIQDPDNPYYNDPAVLEAILKGGDALADAQDKDGNWTFRKKDNSTWGQTLEPWAFGRWMATYHIIQDAMPAQRREKWERSLLLGCRRLVAALRTARVHNKTAYHASTVYCAGLCFHREDWKQAARDFMAKVSAEQSPGGWWSEHSGPLVGYNVVYVQALGIYHALSGDASVLEALRRAAVYHATLTYPNGNRVETVDERNPFEPGIDQGNAGFSFTPEGRGYLLHQYRLRNWSIPADSAAAYLLYGATGDAAPLAADRERSITVIGNQEAMVIRHKPWMVCMSAFTCEPSMSRWIQDRQNFVSIFHDSVGLIVGGGNTKLQPFWSNFTVGDTSLLRHQPGDENPDFNPKGNLLHTASAARLRTDEDSPGLDLTYGKELCRITVRVADAQHLTLVCESTANSSQPVEGHIVFMPYLNAELKTAAGKATKLGQDPIDWKSSDLGPWFMYGSLRVTVPNGARLLWPAKQHNPYKKDGSSTLQHARLVVCVPFSNQTAKQEVGLEVASHH
jgi:hypothetical protein